MRHLLTRRPRIAALAFAGLLSALAWSTAGASGASDDDPGSICGFGTYTQFYSDSSHTMVVGTCSYPCYAACVCEGSETPFFSIAYFPCAPIGP